MTEARRGVLYHVLCAAPPALDAAAFVVAAQRAGWDVCVVASPRAAGWVEVDRLAALTGHPVRSDYKRPGEPDVLPPADAFAVAPATFNTINKWAAGIADTLVLGLLTEALGLGRPVVAAPHVNAAQTGHPAWAASLATLRGAGVRLVDVAAPAAGDAPAAGFPWPAVLRALEPIQAGPPPRLSPS